MIETTSKLEQELVEFHARLAEAMDATSAAVRAIHHARQMSPTGLELDVLRSAAARATDLVADLHTIATSEELAR